MKAKTKFIFLVPLLLSGGEAAAQSPVSDDFGGSSLNTSVWTFVNPVGNGSFIVGGGEMRLTVPAGSVHDVWSTGDNSARAMQSMGNADFEVAVKFDTTVTTGSQMEGIIVEQDVNTLLRFDFRHDGVSPRLFAASISGGAGNFLLDIPLSSGLGAPLWLKVKRTGNTWTESWSADGTTYTTGGSFIFTLTTSKIGPFVANYGSPASAAPAMTAAVDYFYNTASVPLSPDLTLTKTHAGNFAQGGTGTYTLTARNSGTGPTAGSVTVIDTVPAGLTANTFSGTGWSCSLTPTVTCSRSDVLAAGGSYPTLTLVAGVAANAPSSVTNTASVAGGGETNTFNDAASDLTLIGSNAGPPVSDDFTGSALNTPPWTFVNPTGNGTYSVSGGDLRLTVPAGSLHDVWTTGDNSARAMQPISNADFEVVVKFDSSVTVNSQMQGIIVEQDSTNFLRFDYRNDGVSPRLFAASIAGATGTFQIDVPLSTSIAPPLWLKVKRVGNVWTESWSSNGATYTTGGTFTFALTVSKIGPFAGNYGNTPAAAPAFTAAVDYFSNTATPIVPDLTVTKTHTGSFTQGGTGSYIITASNSGTGSTTGTVTVTDQVPAGLTVTAFSGTGWTCSLSPAVTCTRSTILAPGASYPALTLAVNVSASAPASVTNSVTVSGGGEANTANNTATDVTSVTSPTAPDLTVTKSHTGTFTQGGTGAFTLTAKNVGTASTAGTTTVTDTLPGGLTAATFSGTGWTCALTPTVTCSRNDVLAAGASFPALTLTVNVANNAPASVTNTASVSGGGETNTSNNTASDVTTIVGVPDMTVTKTHTGNFTLGGTGTYTITARNNGSGATSGSVTVTDTLPAGLTATAFSGTGWTCALSPTINCTRSDALVGGGSYPALTLAVSVASNAPASVTNTATVAGGGEVNTANDTASDPTSVVAPDLTITKTHTGNFTPGGTGAYTITASNGGNAPTAGPVTVTDAVPTGLTATAFSGTGWTCALTPTVNCTRSDALAANSSYPALTLTVSVAGNAPASVTNTATVAGGGEVNTANDTASDPTSVLAPDLTITKTHTGNFTPGGTGAYTITASNGGNAPTSGPVTVTDAVPTGLTATAFSGTGWTCALTPTVNCTRSDALVGGGSYPALTLAVSVASNAPASVTNTATVAGGGEVNTANDTASDPTSVVAPDLTITKTHTGNFTPGGTGAYTITASNGGNAPTAGPVTVTDAVPTGLTATAFTGTGWTCALTPTVNCTRSDALAANASYPALTLTVSVASNAPASVTNTATVAGGGEVNTANDTASDPTSVLAPDLTLTKTHTGNFTPGGTGAYTITARNSGNAVTLGTVTVTDTLPTGLTATAFSGLGWTCALTPTVNCTRNDVLAANASYPALTLTVSVASDAPASVTNTATVAGGGEINTSNDTAADPTTISAPDLTLTKTHTGSFAPGGTGSYTMIATNSGNAVTSGTVTVTDTIPAGLTATAFTGTGWTCALTPTVDCTRSDALAANASYPALTLTVSVASNAPASVTNTATVDGGGEVDASNDTATDPTVIAGPDLTLTKTHTGNFTPGGTGVYTIVAINAGNAPTFGTVSVTDTLPTGLTATAFSGTGWACALTPTVNCTRSDSLAGGGSYPALTLTVSVANNAPASVTNTATVAGGGEINTANDTASDPTSIVAPDLTITKSHTGNFTPGGTGVYTITATNGGNAPTSGPVTVTDAVPTGLTATAFTGTGWTCALTPTVNCTRSDALAANASYPTLTLTVSVASNAPASVTNTATVAGGGQVNTANDTASDQTSVVAPDLTITKTHTGNFTPGGTGSYTITATNGGNAPTSGPVTVTDAVPTGLTATAFTGTGWTCALTPTVNCTRSDSLAANSSYPTLTLTVSVAINAPASVTNTATVAGGGEVNTANDTASDPTSVVAPDLTITKSHTGSFTPGGTGVYTITATNGGNAPTSGPVTVTDAVPTGLTATAFTGTGWTCALTPTVNCTRSDSLAANSSYPTLTLTVSVAINAPASVTNTATVAGGGEVNTANDTASDPTSVVAPDLTITKSHTGSFTPGGTGVYTITATNGGNAPTSGPVTVTDAVPTGLTATAFSGTGWTCALTPTVNCTRSDSLAANSSYPTLTLTVSVASNASASVTNTATVAGGGEVNTANDTASDPTSVVAPDLTITKTHTGNFTPGGTGAYTITATNGGNAPTSGPVTVTDAVPTGLTATAFSGTGWTCALTPTVNCTRSDVLAANASYPALTLAVSVASNAPASVTNTATVAGGGEVNTANDTASDPTSVLAPDLTITKTHTGNFTPGGTGVYTITATNGGNAPTSGPVTVTDAVPTGLTATAFTGTGWTCALTPTINCTRSDALPANASYPALTLTVGVASNAPASVTNTATVAGGGEVNTANDTASDPTSVLAPDLTITKSHTGNFTQGGTGAYTITATNGGNAPTSGPVTVTDTIPAGLTATAFTGTGWTCALTPTINCTRSDALAANASYPALTLTVSVASNAPASVTNTATVAGGGEVNTANDTASDPTVINIVVPVSDDFHSTTLNSSLWTFENPVGDASYRTTGTNMLISIPAGISHDAWSTGNNSARLVQSVPNANFSVEVLFQSSVTNQYQTQGILAEQDASTFTRFDIYSDGTQTHLFSASVSGSSATVWLDTVIPSGNWPLYLRVTRSGNTWTSSWSNDGLTYNAGASFTYAMTLNKLGPFASNSGATPPPFTASIDYFFNTASRISPEDAGLPGLVTISAIPSLNGSVISWVTDRPASTKVEYGTTSAYGTSTATDNTLLTGHNVALGNLTCGTVYNYRVTSADGGGNTSVSSNQIFTTNPCGSSSPVSDDFSASSLNTALWTFVNPVNDGGTATVNSSGAVLNVPGGNSHDVWTGGNNSVRIMQSIANADFDIEVKFNSMVSATYQMQGLIVEQDSANFIRFDVVFGSCEAAVFSAGFSSGNPTVLLNHSVRNGNNLYLRVTRAGSNWAFSYSYDGKRWTPAFQFVRSLNVTRIGPFAGNAGVNGGAAPAFTSVVSYFINRGAPPATVRGQSYPGVSVAPSISLFYGNNQTFGQKGVPQQWVNILGNATAFYGLASLSYTLNGGAAQTLWQGENQVRLVEPGDFNVEIDYASLQAGANTVVISAVDNIGNLATQSVTVNKITGQTWPNNYTIDWSTAGSIQSVAQIVDGQWQIQADGTVRPLQIGGSTPITGYDRLITFGDRVAWQNYDVTAQVTINSYSCHDFGVGFIVGWQGHTTNQYGQPLPDQPRTGHPFPGLFWYSLEPSSAVGLNIYTNTVARPETRMVQDTATQLQVGVLYTYRFRVQTNAIGGSHYSYKVWPTAQAEPASWDIEVDGEVSQGSIVIGLHKADASIGKIVVTGL